MTGHATFTLSDLMEELVFLDGMEIVLSKEPKSVLVNQIRFQELVNRSRSR